VPTGREVALNWQVEESAPLRQAWTTTFWEGGAPSRLPAGRRRYSATAILDRSKLIQIFDVRTYGAIDSLHGWIG
jgi:hypothetical protein